MPRKKTTENKTESVTKQSEAPSIPTFNEWIKILKQKKLYHSPYRSKFDKSNQSAVNNHFISVKWTTGGISGGSCWDSGDDDSHYATDGEPEPEFDELDKILEEYWADIPWLKYKVFCRECVKHSTDSYNEYYGNYTNYAIKTVDLYDLYLFLCKNNKIPCLE